MRCILFESGFDIITVQKVKKLIKLAKLKILTMSLDIS